MPFWNEYNWKGIKYQSGKSDCKKYEKNDPTTALIF